MYMTRCRITLHYSININIIVPILILILIFFSCCCWRFETFVRRARRIFFGFV